MTLALKRKHLKRHPAALARYFGSTCMTLNWPTFATGVLPGIWMPKMLSRISMGDRLKRHECTAYSCFSP